MFSYQFYFKKLWNIENSGEEDNRENIGHDVGQIVRGNCPIVKVVRSTNCIVPGKIFKTIFSKVLPLLQRNSQL